MFQLQWIWHNLKGYRKFYVTALVLSIVCNALYLTTPYFSKELVDKFLSSKDALFNLEHERKLFWLLLAGHTFSDVSKIRIWSFMTATEQATL